MQQELADQCEKQGLKTTKSKTNVMTQYDTPLQVNTTETGNGDSYVYLAQGYKTRKQKQDNDIQRRITHSPSTAVSG